MLLQRLGRLIPGRARHFTTATSQVRSSERKSFPARSWFFPKKSRAGLEKTRILGADAVILDLEDSVAADEKASVRNLYVQALDDGVLSETRVFVRLSDLDARDEVEEDIRALTRPEVLGFVLPKVKCSDQIRRIDDFLTKVEKERNLETIATKLIPLLEVPEAFFHTDTLASCSPRNLCVIVGSGDFTATAVCDDHSPTYDAFFSLAAIAAKAAGIEAVCGVHDKIDDHAGLENFCIKMKRCGYVGGLALTPKQIPIINNVFDYTPRELKWIDQVLEKREGDTNNIKLIKPSVQESRQMIGPPHKDKAKAMRERHETQLREFKTPRMTITSHRSDTIRGTQLKKGISPNIKFGEIIQTPYEVT
ncbi:MAG: aldolase/citrate lyase family protein, partial [Proteobacteria bacterium]|nr:aldolase/citrate lyase family protein [Pseudomonadota bacterium]